MKRNMRLAIMVCALGVALLGGLALYHYEKVPEYLRLKCFFYEWSGWYCPGCGASRACYAILHGNLRVAAEYNILLFVLLPFLALYLLVRGVDWVITGKNHVDCHVPDKLLYVVLGIVLLYGVVRNISVWPFVLLRP